MLCDVAETQCSASPTIQETRLTSCVVYGKDRVACERCERSAAKCIKRSEW